VTPFDAHITFCYTRDLPETARFYEDVVGLPLVLDQGQCRIYEVAGSAYIGFCERKNPDEPRGVLLTFVTDDVDGWHSRLVAGGARSETPPAHNSEYGIYHCFLRDPSGYLLEIQRFDDPDWRTS
jgi:catechol 2,3-dioxygenase-like lactoylglutathione lyase family enzyme